MNVIQAAQDYVTKMIGDVPGMKALIVDKETSGIISLAFTLSQLYARDVFLLEMLSSEKRERMPHLKAIVFVRPTSETISLLAEELRNPKYSEYHVIFSNTTTDAQLQQLAENDEQEVIQSVFEMFADFYAINRNLYSLNLPECSILHDARRWDQRVFTRIVDGVLASLLALKKRPVIRYAARSPVAKRVADEVYRHVEHRSDLFDFRRGDTSPVLLILDRRDDPVTPLLTQWTYQAMIHELLTIHNGRVSLKGAPGIKKELEEVIMGQEIDPFFEKNLYSDFGVIGAEIKRLVDEFQAKTNSHKAIDTIAEMKAFVEEYPEFRKLSGSVSKHVAVVSELSRIVDARSLLSVSELEQLLACSSDHSDAVDNLEQLFRNREANVAPEDLLRCVLLYSLRYEHHSSNKTAHFLDMLAARGLDPYLLRTAAALQQYAGASVRGGDLFKTKSILSMFSRAVAELKGGVKGVTNIYTQHVPQVIELLSEMLKSKLSEKDYPFQGGVVIRDRPQDIIVFFVGGVTFEEGYAIHRLVNSTPSLNVIVGGTHVHNSRSFIQDVLAFSS